jgi:hypothetical protein
MNLDSLYPIAARHGFETILDSVKLSPWEYLHRFGENILYWLLTLACSSGRVRPNKFWRSRQSMYLSRRELEQKQIVVGLGKSKEGIMRADHKITIATLPVIALVTLGVTVANITAALAQNTARIRGTIERIDGSNYVIKTRDGTEVIAKLAENALVLAVVRASYSDIKQGSFIGVTGMPQADGSQRCLEIHIFPEAMRGTGEGHRPWDLRPQSTMTNATVDQMVTAVGDYTLTLKYKDGEKQIVVPPDCPIVTYASSDKGELKPGAKIFINAATKQPDGTLVVPRINVGRDIAPPM